MSMICYTKEPKVQYLLFFMVIGLTLGHGITLMHLSSSLEIPTWDVKKHKSGSGLSWSTFKQRCY